ncbi:hypothetical protein [Bradyrhizobium sp. Arg816]|uniref:hypothetical protein n=1 Tax=Bradyrhizobium sp. Arg816 TaxID=2998491 RepID=UPI00249EF00F|nr:hypothetical protein [Bradyrhizobium sp. Arg816]MDI3563560.1 hypothetical protein [Bradyrhizobium sp. Arg816]
MRLKEEYFSHINIENLAIPGGSPLTGLEIVERAIKRKPRIIVVEINILSRGVDSDLVARYRGTTLPAEMLRPVRAFAAFLQPKPPAIQKMDMLTREAILHSEPIPTASALQKIWIETVPEYNKPIYDAVIKQDATTLESLVNKLRANRVTVYLFEMPVSPEHSHTRYYRTMREEISRRFQPDDMLQLKYALSELHWSDGSHLDERSALIVSDALENAIAKKLGLEAMR